MSADLDLEQRYRRVLRLLPRYYRDKWEEDMVATFLDGWLTGDPDEDSVTMEYDQPTRQEIVSVIGLAARLRLGGAGAPRRYFAWGQAVRNAVLGVMLAHAVWGLSQLALFARSRHLIGWLPPPPGGFWPALSYATGYAWIVVFVALVLVDYRTARVIAILVIGADATSVLHQQLAGTLASPFANWAYVAVIDLAPVLAMAAFHRDAPPVARRWSTRRGSGPAGQAPVSAWLNCSSWRPRPRSSPRMPSARRAPWPHRRPTGNWDEANDGRSRRTCRAKIRQARGRGGRCPGRPGAYRGRLQSGAPAGAGPGPRPDAKVLMDSQIAERADLPPRHLRVAASKLVGQRAGDLAK